MAPTTDLFELGNPGDCQSRGGNITIDGSELLKEITCNLTKSVSGSGLSFSGGEGTFTIPAGGNQNTDFTVTACNEGGISVDLSATYSGNLCGTAKGGYSATLEKEDDHPDDNLSPGVSSYPTSIVLTDDTLGSPDEVGIFIYGWTIGYAHILGRYDMPIIPVFSNLNYWKNPEKPLYDEISLIVMGSGALSGFYSSEFKNDLEDYIVNGGNLLVFTQKYGSNLSVLPGDIDGYGWNEDQSCLRNAAYLNQWHPVFAGQNRQVMTCNVDGYISEYPNYSEVLLGRTKNSMPALLYYNYGAGTVIVSSLYSDWGYGHNQTFTAELRLIRDLTTWALNPDIEIPEFYPRSSVSVPVSIKYAVSDTVTVNNAIIKIYTPDRDLYDSLSVPVTLNPGEETEWIWNSSSLPENLGLWVIDYALMNGSGNWIQEYNRGAVFAQKVDVPIGDYNLGDFQMWATSDKEEIFKGDTANFEIFVKSNTDSIFEGKIMVGVHEDNGRWWKVINSIPDVTIPSDSIVMLNCQLPLVLSTSVYFGFYKNTQSHHSEFFKNSLTVCQKGVWVEKQPFPIVFSRDNYRYALGRDTLHYNVTIENKLSTSCTTFVSIYTLLNSDSYDLWSNVIDIAAKEKEEFGGAFFPMDYDTTPGKGKLCCDLFYKDSLWNFAITDFELTYPALQCSITVPDSFNYEESNSYTVTLSSEGSYIPSGKFLVECNNFSDSLIVGDISIPETTFVFDYNPDVWEVSEKISDNKLKVQYKYGDETIKKEKRLPFRLPQISAFRPVYQRYRNGFLPGDTAVLKAQLALTGKLYGVPLEFCLWSDYLGADTLRDTIVLNPCSHKTIELRTYADLDIPADTPISYNYRMNYLNKEYSNTRELQYIVYPPEAVLNWPVNDTFSIGSTIPIRFTNSIRTPSVVNLDRIYLRGKNGEQEQFEGPGEKTIPGEGSYTFFVTVPQWMSGRYYLSVQADMVEGTGINLGLYQYNGCPIYIDGIEANIKVSTFKDYYGYGEDIPFSSLLKNGKYGWNGAESLKVARMKDTLGQFSIWDITEYIDTFGLIPDGSGGLVLDSVYSLECLWGQAYGQVGSSSFSNKREKALGFSGSSYSITIDEWGNLWLSYNDVGRIEKYDFISMESLGEFNFPDSIGNIEGVVNSQGMVYLIASDSGKVYKMNSISGNIMGNIQPPGRGFLDLAGIAIKKSGNVLAVEDGTKTLWEFSSSGDSISAFLLPPELHYGDIEYYDGTIYISTYRKIITVEGTVIDSFGVSPDLGNHYGPIAINDDGKIAVALYEWPSDAIGAVDKFDKFDGESYVSVMLMLFSSTGDIEAELYWLPFFYDLTFYKKDIISFEYVEDYGNFGVYKEFGKESGSVRAGYWDLFQNLPKEYRFLSYKSSDLPNSGSVLYRSVNPGGYPGEEDLLPLENSYGSDQLLPIYITMQGDWHDSPVFYDCLLNLKVLGIFDSLIVENGYDLNLSPHDNISFSDTIKDTLPSGDYCVLGEAYSDYPQETTSDWKLFTVIGDNLTFLLKADKEEGFAGDTFKINPLIINPLPLEEDSLRLLVKGYYNESDTAYIDTSFDLLAESADSFPFMVTPEEPLIIRAELIRNSYDTLRKKFSPIIKSGRLLTLNITATEIADLSPFRVTTEMYNYSFDDLFLEVERIFLSDTLKDSVYLKVEDIYTFVDTFATEEPGTLKVIATAGNETFEEEKFIDFGMDGVVLLDSMYQVSPDSVQMSGVIRNEGLYPLECKALFCLFESEGTQSSVLNPDPSPRIFSRKDTKITKEKKNNNLNNQPIAQSTASLLAKHTALSSVHRVGKEITLSRFIRRLVNVGVDTSFSMIYLPPGQTDTVPILFNRHDVGSYELQAFLFTDSLDFMFDSASSNVNVVGDNQLFVDTLIVSPNCDTNGDVSLTVVLDNRSFSYFSGNITISSPVCYFDSVISLPFHSKDTITFLLADPIDEGIYTFTSVIKDGGIPVSQKLQDIELRPAYRFDSLPVNLTVAAPDSGIIRIPVRNIGNAKGERVIRVNLADVIRIDENTIIEPGSVDTFYDNFLIPEDFPGGEYFADASVLKSIYPEIDTFFNLKVNGLAIRATDSLDKFVYNVNDTAELSVFIKNKSLWSGNLLASLQYGELELDTSFLLGGMEKGVLNEIFPRDTIYLDTSGVYMFDPINSESYDSLRINWSASLSDSFVFQMRTGSLIGRGNWITIEKGATYVLDDWMQIKFDNKSAAVQWVDAICLFFNSSGCTKLDNFPEQKEVVTFDVPVDSSEKKLGWGIYYPSGRSVVLDERYLYISDGLLTVWTDKARYEILDTVHAILCKNFYDTNYNFEYRVYFSPTEEIRDTFKLKKDTMKFSFVVPEWTRSGTYSIDYLVKSNGTQINADSLDLTYIPNFPHDSRRDSKRIDKKNVLLGLNPNPQIPNLDLPNQPINESTAVPRESIPLAKQWIRGKPRLRSLSDSVFLSGEHLFDVNGITIYFKNAEMDTNLYYEGETAKVRTKISSDIDLPVSLNISSTGSIVNDRILNIKKDVPNKFEFKYSLTGCKRGMNELYLHLSKDSVSLAGFVLYFDVYVSDTIAPVISVFDEPSNTYSSNRAYQLKARIYDPDTNGTPFYDTLYYRIASVGGSSWQALLAHSTRGDTNRYLIPSQPNGTHIEYALIARDEFGNRASYPEKGSNDFWVLSPLKPTWSELTYAVDTSAVLIWNPPEEMVYYHCGLFSDTVTINDKIVAARFITQCLPARLKKIGLEIINQNGIPQSDTLRVFVYAVSEDSLPGMKIDSFEFTGQFTGYTEFELPDIQILENGVFIGIKGSNGLNALLDGFGKGTHTAINGGGSWNLATSGELLMEGIISHLPSPKLRGSSEILAFDVFKSVESADWIKIASGITSTSCRDESIQENQKYSYKIMASFGNPVDSFFSVSREMFIDLSPPSMDTIVVDELDDNELLIWTVFTDTSGVAWDSLGYKIEDTMNVIPEDSCRNNKYFFSVTLSSDTLAYFLKVKDASLIGNYARYPESGFYKWGDLAGIEELIPDSTYLFRMLNVLVGRDVEIKYALSEEINVRIMFFDVLGRKARTLVDENQKAGYYSVPIKSAEFPGGVYFLRMEAGEYRKTLKLVKLR